MSYDAYAYNGAGQKGNSETPLSKNGEYAIEVATGRGGSITLEAGAGFRQTAVALPYAENQILGEFPNANPVGPWYLITITYDGVSQACIALNDSTEESCVSGVTIEQSASRLQLGSSLYVEYMLAYDRLLSTADRQSLYNSTVRAAAPYFTAVNSAAMTTYNLQGASCVRGDGWGTTYTGTGTGAGTGIYLPNPYSTCTIQTNAPFLYLNETVLQDTIGDQASNSAEIEVSLDNPEWGAFAYSTLFPINLGNNTFEVALPGDGALHSVTFDVSSYVGYSGYDATPTTNMRAGVVEQVAVPAGYVLKPVVAPTPVEDATYAWLFYADSISIGSQTNFIASDGYVSQLREEGAYPGPIEFESYGGRALYHDMPTPAAATAFADTLKSRWGCPAKFTAEVMTNDYGRYVQTAASGAANMTAFWAEWNKICTRTVNIQQSAFMRSNEGENRLGDTLPKWRQAMAQACSSAKSCTNVDATAAGYPGPNVDCPNPGSGPASGYPSQATDGVHFTTCGATMARMKEFGQYTQVAQKITFEALSTVTYGTAPIELNAVAASGGPVEYTVVSGPGKISGNLLTVTGAGKIVVTAYQGGNAQYQPASFTRSIDVNPAVLTITGNHLIMVEHAAVPTLTYSVSGLVNGDVFDKVTTGAPALTTLVTSRTGPGAYPILVNLGTLKVSVNYRLTRVNGVLTVEP
jgi:hypothetical protein